MPKRAASPVLAVALVLLGFQHLRPTALMAQAECSFNPTFQAMHDQIPEIVGDCLDPEHLNEASGLVEQRTTGGLLMLRPADGLTGFTDGSMTWLLRPEGLVSRSNTDPLFPWEVAAPTSTAPAMSAEPTAVAMDPHSLPTGVIYQAPYSSGQRWLGNATSCRNDGQPVNPISFKCSLQETVFRADTSIGPEVIIAFERRHIKPAEAKQGPGDRITMHLFSVNYDFSRNIHSTGSTEVVRFTDAPDVWRLLLLTLPPNVYEAEFGINDDPRMFRYRFRVIF
jgi:hypothetical protein